MERLAADRATERSARRGRALPFGSLRVDLPAPRRCARRVDDSGGTRRGDNPDPPGHPRFPCHLPAPEHPARTAVTVDHISRGRVDVGLGLGWYEREHEENGFPFGATRERFALLAEQIDVITRSWTAKRFDHDGRFYSLRGQRALPGPYQDPHPRLILGGAVKPQFAALAAQHASEVNTLTSLPDELVARRKLLDDACASVGRDPETLTLSTLVTCFLGETRREGEQRMRAFVASGDDEGHFSNAVSAARSSWIVGSVDEVAARLSPLEALGVTRLIVRHMNFVDDEMVALVGRRLGQALA